MTQVQNPLQDSFGRSFQYLRLSVTDVCNFRCVYCLPNGFKRHAGEAEPLTVDEIRNLVAGFVELGVWKVRLTGGEPTVRRDIVDIASAVSGVPGIRTVAISTNGYRLSELAAPLREAGVRSVNVSIDSLDPEVFRQITGRDLMGGVMDGVQTALKAGFSPVKVNAVLLKDWNEADIDRFVEWVRERPVSVRFIELMRMQDNTELFAKHALSGAVVRERLVSAGWQVRARQEGDGPAVELFHPKYEGRIGLITPYGDGFCNTCNRLRVSCRGELKLCLFGESGFSLRPLLQSPSQREELVGLVRALVERKTVSHSLKEGKYGNTWNLSSIGG